MLVRSANSFYAVRFLLGIVEPGFFPGVILYLTFWFTSKHRARMVAAFMSAIPVSGIIAGPISGWILARMNGAGHLSAWQWLFLMEGIPSLIAGHSITFSPSAIAATAKSRATRSISTANDLPWAFGRVV
jgi:MFS family permease